MILGASFDGAAANARFGQKFNFNFPLLTAPKEMAISYGAAADASAKSCGRVGVIIDPDGKVKEWHAKVSAQAFPEEALKKI